MAEDRLRQWQDRRASRMNRLTWLRKETPLGRKPVWYAQGELLVLADHQQETERALGRLRGVQAEQLTPGLVRYRADQLDAPALARTLGPVAAPNHVFLSTPFEHGGPFGPPVPATSPRTTPRAIQGDIAVAVIDTGVWSDSPLPATAYTAASTDYEDDTDVDNDGVIDGDVGHANFIIGVIAAQTQRASIRALRLLDTFGVCTEADLIGALARVQDEKLINLSLGGFTLDDRPPLALGQALSTLLTGRQRLVVAAAGNDGQRGKPFWPAAFAGTQEAWANQIVAVAAHDGADVCDWSNAGDWVSLAAPGADITSTFVRHQAFPSGWALWSGTSFATPHVVAALADELYRTGNVQAARNAVMARASARLFGGYPSLL